jgi:hypothetical protein
MATFILPGTTQALETGRLQDKGQLRKMNTLSAELSFLALSELRNKLPKLCAVCRSLVSWNS